jgi:hypothetical protein
VVTAAHQIPIRRQSAGYGAIGPVGPVGHDHRLIWWWREVAAWIERTLLHEAGDGAGEFINVLLPLRAADD